MWDSVSKPSHSHTRPGTFSSSKNASGMTTRFPPVRIASRRRRNSATRRTRPSGSTLTVNGLLTLGHVLVNLRLGFEVVADDLMDDRE